MLPALDQDKPRNAIRSRITVMISAGTQWIDTPSNAALPLSGSTLEGGATNGARPADQDRLRNTSRSAITSASSAGTQRIETLSTRRASGTLRPRKKRIAAVSDHIPRPIAPPK